LAAVPQWGGSRVLCAGGRFPWQSAAREGGENGEGKAIVENRGMSMKVESAPRARSVVRAGMGLACGLAVLLCAGALAGAHDGPHAGGSVKGKVVSLAEDTLTVETEDGTVSVTLARRTAIVRDGGALKRAALIPGTLVDVHGSKLPGGGFAAREIVIEAGAEDASAPDQLEHSE